MSWTLFCIGLLLSIAGAASVGEATAKCLIDVRAGVRLYGAALLTIVVGSALLWWGVHWQQH